MFDFFRKKTSPNKQTVPPLEVDMHSHLLAGLDDGSESLTESISMIRTFASLGYRKLITTPHVMGDFYKNSPKDISAALEILQETLVNENLEMELHAAAEYYLDEWFASKVKKGDKLLTISGNYVLVETSYLNRPAQLDEVIFDMRSNGYIPVLAHPERYVYLYKSFEKFQELYEKEVLFQININSLTGYYSGPAKKFAELLIENKMVDMAGSDCHNEKHLTRLVQARETDHYAQMLALPLLNNSL